MRVLIAVLMAVALTGCATGARSPALAGMDNVSYETERGHDFIKEVTYKFEGPTATKGDALPLCVAKVVRNDSVTLGDKASSFFGAYTGTYYQKNSAREAGGGSVIQYASDDRSQVEAQGVEKYTFGGLLPIEVAVRYGLSAKVAANARTFVFSGLNQAQLQTGAASNDGFNKVGAWPGARPERAVEAVKKVAVNINDCLSQQ